MRRGFALLATLAVAAACGSFGNDDDTPLTGDDAGTSPVEAGSTSSSGGDAAQTEAGGSPSFCDLANATVCTDFEDTTNAARQWAKVLDTPEPKGSGRSPVVRSSGDPARGNVYVTRFEKGAGSVESSLSRAAHHNPTPAWGETIPPRVFEVKVHIAESSEKDPFVALLGWNGDDGTPHSVLVSCPNDKPICGVYVGRLAEPIVVPNVFIPKATWTKLVVNIGPTTYSKSGKDDPPSITVTTSVPGEEPRGSAVTFPDVVDAPHKLRVDVGLGLRYATSEGWEVWYDDLALSY